jgi:hypothetical protein
MLGLVRTSIFPDTFTSVLIGVLGCSQEVKVFFSGQVGSVKGAVCLKRSA